MSKVMALDLLHFLGVVASVEGKNENENWQLPVRRRRRDRVHRRSVIRGRIDKDFEIVSLGGM
jgi:hypothetical protein